MIAKIGNLYTCICTHDNYYSPALHISVPDFDGGIGRAAYCLEAMSGDGHAVDSGRVALHDVKAVAGGDMPLPAGYLELFNSLNYSKRWSFSKSYLTVASSDADTA